MSDSKSRIAELQKRRAESARRREDREKRDNLGPQLAKKIGKCIDQPTSLCDFDYGGECKDLLNRSDDYRSYPGLIAAYVDSRKAATIVECCCNLLGLSDGYLHFLEYSFLGSLSVRNFDLRKLIALAATLQDEVVFSPSGASDVVAIDFYVDKVSGDENHYSLVVQGSNFEGLLQPCFRATTLCDA